MWGGNPFALVAEALALVAGFMSGTIRRSRLRRDDRLQSPPIAGMSSGTELPRL